MEDDLAKVFEYYQTFRKVFDVVSTKHNKLYRMKESNNVVDHVKKW